MDRPRFTAALALALATALLGSGLGGCMIGAGPTVGVRTTGEFSFGWEASVNAINSYMSGGGGGVQVGQSIPLGPRRSTVYFAGQGFWRFREASEDDVAGYVGGSGGLAVREGGTQPYASLWAMALRGTVACATSFGEDSVLTLELGVRWIAGAGELYLAPKVNTYGNYCTY
jgi:hypothetical protein